MRIGRTAASIVVGLCLGASDSQAARLAGHVLDIGTEPKAGIAGVYVIATCGDIRKTDLTNSGGYYQIEGLPRAKEVHVSFDRIGYAERPTLEEFVLQGDKADADIPMVKDDGTTQYYAHVAQAIVEKRSRKDALRAVEKFKLPSATEDMLRARVIELLGLQHVATPDAALQKDGETPKPATKGGKETPEMRKAADQAPTPIKALASPSPPNL